MSILTDIDEINNWRGWYHVRYNNSNIREIYEWVQTTFGYNGSDPKLWVWNMPAQSLPGTFQFKHEKDALIFLLKWGT